jgi:hypothetical protein
MSLLFGWLVGWISWLVWLIDQSVNQLADLLVG